MGKPAISSKVDLTLANLGGVDGMLGYSGPAKIVRKGENRICGHYTVLDKCNGGGLVYYD